MSHSSADSPPAADVSPGVASRRSVLVGAAAVVVLGGCATYDERTPAADTVADPATAPGAGGAVSSGATSGPPGAAPTTAPGAAPTTAPGAGAPDALAATADIPVGGGTIFEQRRLVVTQPQAGVFKAFSAVCTHVGCAVAEVRNGTINCPCHGSQFKIADGSVAKGPAGRPLAPVAITVDGQSLRLA